MKLVKDANGGIEIELGLAAWKRFIIAMTLLALLFSVATKLIEVDPVKFGEMILVALFSYISGLLTFYYLDHKSTASDEAGETPKEFGYVQPVGGPSPFEGKLANPAEVGRLVAEGSVGPETTTKEG